jgi:hypothetical protein
VEDESKVEPSFGELGLEYWTVSRVYMEAL